MLERAALLVAAFASIGALTGLLMRLDRSLLAIRYQFSLLTLLIVLAVAPPVGAAGYRAWKMYKIKPSPWYVSDGALQGPPMREGYHWKLTRNGLIEVPDEGAWAKRIGSQSDSQ